MFVTISNDNNESPYREATMKRIFSVILGCLLAVPSSMMAAQAAAPAQNAPISAWHSWFTSLRRPTRQDVLRANQFVKSKWQCMVRGRNCSAIERNSLRVLAAAVAAAIVKGLHSLHKNRQKKKQDEQAARRQAQQAQWLATVDMRRGQESQLGDRSVRDRQEAIGEMIEELKASRRTWVQPQDILCDDAVRFHTVHQWGTPQGVAEG